MLALMAGRNGGETLTLVKEGRVSGKLLTRKIVPEFLFLSSGQSIHGSLLVFVVLS
jgi:hypothetical protein